MFNPSTYRAVRAFTPTSMTVQAGSAPIPPGLYGRTHIDMSGPIVCQLADTYPVDWFTFGGALGAMLAHARDTRAMMAR